MRHYVAAILFAGAAFLALGNLAFGLGQVAEPTNTPTPASDATGSPAVSTPTLAAGATGTAAPNVAETAAPTPTAAAASAAGSNSSIPVVVIAGILEAIVVIGVLAFLFRGTPS